MAARKNKIRHDENTKAKIRASQLVNRLQAYVFGQVDMKPAQVTAALGLLRKSIPDLSAVESKTELTHRYVARVPSKAHDVSAWQEQHAPSDNKSLN